MDTRNKVKLILIALLFPIWGPLVIVYWWGEDLWQYLKK